MGKLKIIGSDDKFSYYEFTGRLGMEGKGDMEDEWKSPEEIKEESVAHTKWVEELKEQGRYGEEYTIKIEMEHDPTPRYIAGIDPISSTESYSMVIWDASVSAEKGVQPEDETMRKHREYWEQWSKENPGVDPFPGDGS